MMIYNCARCKGEVIKNYFFNFANLNSDFTVDFNSGEISYHNSHNEKNWRVTLVDTGLETLKGGE